LFARSEKVTPFVVLVSALNVLVHLERGDRSIRIGTLVANRDAKESRRAIGHFVNTVVLCNCVEEMMKLRELVRQVETTVRAAIANQEFPFARLAAELEKNQIPRNELFKVMLIYNLHGSTGYGNDADNSSGSVFASFDSHHFGLIDTATLTACDLVVTLHAIKTQLIGTINYKTNKFSNAVVTRMVTKLTLILKRMLSNPDETVSSLRNTLG
jgi:non-ribosomal peptide synthetase component F